MDEIRILGPEGDRFDALAAMHGVVGTMALEIGRRIISHGGGRHVTRQGRVLVGLTTALAEAFLHGADSLDPATITNILTLMARSQAAERRGLRHDRLLRFPRDWPLAGLQMTAPALGLFATIRLRLMLEQQVLAAAEPKRLAQLQAIRGLEAQLCTIDRLLDRGEIAGAEALRRVIAAFTVMEAAIGDDLVKLLGDDAPAAATILTAGYGCGARA